MKGGVIVTNHRVRVLLHLGGAVYLGGEVARIDYVRAGSYRAVLLMDTLNSEWHRELQMPLLQRAIAEKLQRAESDVSIGCQSLAGGNVLTRTFPSAAIVDAQETGRRLAQRIERAARRRS